MENTLRRGKQKAGGMAIGTGETLFDKGAAAVTGADDAAYSTAAVPAPAPYAPTDYATANGARYAAGPSTQLMYSPSSEAPAAEQTMPAYSTVAAARGPAFAAAPTPAAAAPAAPAVASVPTAGGTFAHKAREARESTAKKMPGAKESATSKLSKGNKASPSSSYKAPKEKAKPVYPSTKTDDDAAEVAFSESEQDYPQERLLAAAPAPAAKKVTSRPQHYQKPVPNGGAPGVPPGLYHQYPPGLPQPGPTGGKAHDGNWTNLQQTQPGVFFWPRPAYEEWYDGIGRRVWVHTATGTMTYDDPYF